MGKRYVFWPAPDGKPYKGTDGKFAPSAMLSHLGTTTKLTPDGGLSFPSFPTIELAIQHMAIVTDGSGKEVNEHDAKAVTWDAVREAIRESGVGKPIDARRLLQIADRLAAQHHLKPSEELCLISSLSIDSFPDKPVKIGDCTIKGMPGRRGGYPLP